VDRVGRITEESTITELCRKQVIQPNQYLFYTWSKEFLKAGKLHIIGDTQRQADSQKIDMVEAILFIWYLEHEGGHVTAGMLFRDTSPKGKLIVTFHKVTTGLPHFEDYSMTGWKKL
jgi:hypothetical protein